MLYIITIILVHGPYKNRPLSAKPRRRESQTFYSTRDSLQPAVYEFISEWQMREVL